MTEIEKLRLKFIICNQEKDKFFAFDFFDMPVIVNDIDHATFFYDRDAALQWFKSNSDFCRKNELFFIRMIQVVYRITDSGI